MPTSKWIVAMLLASSSMVVLCRGQKPETKARIDQVTEVSSGDSILIGGLGGMRIRLGMTRSLILDKLKEYYSVAAVESGDQLAIVEKAEPNSSPVAVISLKDDHVIGVSKTWGTFDQSDAATLAAAFYSVLTSLKNEGQTVARIETKETKNTPQIAITETKIIFGSKMVALVAITTARGTHVSLMEVLSSK